MAVLIDTNIFLAAVYPKDVNHELGRATLRAIKGERIVAAPVLPELFYLVHLVHERMHYAAAIKSFELFHNSAFMIADLTCADMLRMREIMLEYTDNRFDFVDTAIMALAERLDIREIYTFDRRDFQAFRPAHVSYFRLLP